jgi:hypothetical protein
VQTDLGELHLFLVVAGGFGPQHLRIVEEESCAAFGEDILLQVHLVESIPHMANAKHRSYVKVDRIDPYLQVKS